MPLKFIAASPLVASFAVLLAACSAPAPASSSAGGAAGTAGAATAGTGGVAGAAGASGATASGGSGGSAGGGGSAGNAGAAGSAGNAGAAGSGDMVVKGPSAGCTKTTADPINEYVEHNITVAVDPAYADQANRRYFTKLPDGYDASKPWPVVFYGPGCGGSGSEGTPLDAAVSGTAILVFLLYTDGCFSTGDVNSPEIPYFGQALQEVQDNYCTEKSQVFVSGYSSGGWMSNLLACAHGDKIRAIGTAAGGLNHTHPECKGNVAAIMHAGTGDTANGIVNIDEATGIDEGSGAARDRLLEVNGCTQETLPWDAAWPFCKIYQGCQSAYPVVWCEEDTGHSNGGTVTSEGFWKFWSSLPPL